MLIWDRQIPVQHRTAATVNANASSLMFGAMAAMPAADRGLSSVKSVKLFGLELDALVPPWITFTCPNMTALQVNACLIASQPAPIAAIPPCSQLRELRLSRMRLPDNQDAVAVWQHQLRALNGLCSIRLLKHNVVGQPNSRFLETCSVIGGQLTHLTIVYKTAPAGLQQLVAWFPNLTGLHIPHTIVTDEGMEALLSLQHLTNLRCREFLSLQQTYSQRPCAWTQLSVFKLDIPSFDRLPLGAMRSFGGSGDKLRIAAVEDLGAINRITAALASCTGQTSEAGLTLTVDNSRAGVDDARLAALMPLVASCRPTKLVLAGAFSVTSRLLTAMEQHLPSTVKFLEVSKPTFSPGVLPLLLASLPWAVDFLELASCSWEFTEADCIDMCVHAASPIKVKVWFAQGLRPGLRWQEGWEKRVQAAAGHQHVSLEVRWSPNNFIVNEGESEGDD